MWVPGILFIGSCGSLFVSFLVERDGFESTMVPFLQRMERFPSADIVHSGDLGVNVSLPVLAPEKKGRD